MYEVDKILWHRVTGGDYFNVEKELPVGPKGQLHMDLSPSLPVEEFLGIQPRPGKAETHELLDVGVVGDPETVATLQFNKRPNGRWSFPKQNWRSPGTMRHPAWDPRYGWPRNATSPTSTDQGSAVLEAHGGVHVYVVRTTDGKHFAGLTVGDTLPPGWPDALAPLFLKESKSVGLIRASVTSGTLSALANDVLKALSRRKNVLVYGPPGTGKTFAVSEVFRFLRDANPNALQTLRINPSDSMTPFTLDGVTSPLPVPTRTDWVTFHQDYGYEDFMVGLRPTGSGFELEPVAGRLLDVAMDITSGASASGLVVVDEINRGNVPKILGTS